MVILIVHYFLFKSIWPWCAELQKLDYTHTVKENECQPLGRLLCKMAVFKRVWQKVKMV